MMTSSPYRELHIDQEEESKHPSVGFHKRNLEIADPQERDFEEDEFTKLQKLSEQAAAQQRMMSQEPLSIGHIRIENSLPLQSAQTFPFGNWANPMTAPSSQTTQHSQHSPVVSIASSSPPSSVASGSSPDLTPSGPPPNVTYLPVKNIFDPNTYTAPAGPPTDRSSRNIAYLCTRIAEELKIRPQTRDELSAATGFARQRICTVISVFKSIGLVNIRDSNTRRSEIEWNADQAKMFPNVLGYTKQLLNLRATNRALRSKEDELLMKLKKKLSPAGETSPDKSRMLPESLPTRHEAHAEREAAINLEVPLMTAKAEPGADIVEKSSSVEKMEDFPAPIADKIPIFGGEPFNGANFSQHTGQGDEGEPALAAHLFDEAAFGKNQARKR